jgi:hypothetical protein
MTSSDPNEELNKLAQQIADGQISPATFEGERAIIYARQGWGTPPPFSSVVEGVTPVPTPGPVPEPPVVATGRAAPPRAPAGPAQRRRPGQTIQTGGNVVHNDTTGYVDPSAPDPILRRVNPGKLRGLSSFIMTIGTLTAIAGAIAGIALAFHSETVSGGCVYCSDTTEHPYVLAGVIVAIASVIQGVFMGLVAKIGEVLAAMNGDL